MKVELLEHTPNPEKVIAAAARLCYSDSSITDLMEMSDEYRESFLKKIMSLGHQSVIEHCSFTFGIEGISRSCSHQLVRHRLASYSQQSQRYVKSKECFDFNMPDSINNSKFESNYKFLMGLIGEFYSKMLDGGIPPEDARFVLPNAATTKIVMSMNGRELIHFFQHRCCERAQWEIREMATLMLEQVKPILPVIFDQVGPSCLSGPCPEGKMTCGKINKVREKFK